MPKGDGTGPLGQGPGTGRGTARGRGGRFGAGPGGELHVPRLRGESPPSSGNPVRHLEMPQVRGHRGQRVV